MQNAGKTQITWWVGHPAPRVARLRPQPFYPRISSNVCLEYSLLVFNALRRDSFCSIENLGKRRRIPCRMVPLDVQTFSQVQSHSSSWNLLLSAIYIEVTRSSSQACCFGEKQFCSMLAVSVSSHIEDPTVNGCVKECNAFHSSGEMIEGLYSGIPRVYVN